jgi:pimeloyl-ACP methyl ester carboxylesterase
MNYDQPRDGYVNVNGINLHYLDWGGTGSPIVIVHATGFLGRIYAPIAHELRAIGHVFGYDQRGHGDSGPAPNEEYNWSATVADLRGFIAAMGFESVRGLGHSAGATALGAVSALSPGLVSRAVLVDPIVHDATDRSASQSRGQALVAGTLKRRRVFDSVEHAMSHLGAKPPFDTWDKSILRAYCDHGTRERADGTRELKCDPAVEAKLYATSRDFDGLSLLLKSETRLLVISTKQAHELRPSALNHLRSELKNARILDFPEANHLLPMESPAEIARIAVGFLGEK